LPQSKSTRSVHVNLIKHGTFCEQIYDETVYTPLTDLEPPQQPAALLRTLKKLKSTQARHAHGQLYDNSDAVLLQDPAAAAAAAAAASAAAGNGPIQGHGQHLQGQGGGVHWPPQPNALPALQIPPLPAVQKDTRPRVESMSESEGDFENALDRTIIQSSDETETPPTCTPPPSPLRTRRQPSPVPSPAWGARPRTRKQTNNDGENLGKLHDQPFPRERKKYERKKK
jgi:hypothetical protein